MQKKGLHKPFVTQEEVDGFLNMIEYHKNLKTDKQRLIQFSGKSIKTRIEMQALMHETIERMFTNVENNGENLDSVINIIAYCKEMGYHLPHFEKKYRVLENTLISPLTAEER